MKVNITLQVEACLRESGMNEGLGLGNTKNMNFTEQSRS